MSSASVTIAARLDRLPKCRWSYCVTGVFVLIAVAMVLVFAIVGFWGPKTSGLRLEAIAR